MHAEPAAVAVIGCGAWGAAFGGCIAAAESPVTFWDCNATRARQAAAATAHTHAVATLAEATATAELIIVAVSSAGFASVLRQLAGSNAPVVWLTKGFEPTSGAPLYRVAADTLASERYGVISGPSFAVEISRGLPAALSLAMCRRADGEWVRARLHRPSLRLYLHDDVIGICIGGAVKNIIAIAAGISDGLQFGENARAALIARGLAEMGVLTDSLGGRRDTLLGLSGVGDLTLTCCSDLSRNRRLGLALAAGDSADSDTTCEGRAAAAAVAELARTRQLELPIISTVAAVLAGECTPAAAAAQLLARPPR